MLVYALVLFGLAAALGFLMLTLRALGRSWPLGLALVHGLFAASGLVLVLYAVLTVGADRRLGIAAVLFVLAALFGFTLLIQHLRRKTLPSVPSILLHGLTALVAFLLLLLYISTGG
ncbi:MAG: hypothetical protein ACRD5G_02185 [Candidatus Acidiferrales bacterium]